MEQPRPPPLIVAHTSSHLPLTAVIYNWPLRLPFTVPVYSLHVQRFNGVFNACVRQLVYAVMADGPLSLWRGNEQLLCERFVCSDAPVALFTGQLSLMLLRTRSPPPPPGLPRPRL